MSRIYTYPCPDCRSTNVMHGERCDQEGVPRQDIEKSYTDILSVLHMAGPHKKPALIRECHGEWDDTHDAVLTNLISEFRVRKNDDDKFEIVPEEERQKQREVPHMEPLKTIYEKGSVPGAHDNAIFAIISWFEMNDFSWEESKELTLDWLDRTGTWERGGFEEDDPELLVNNKRHVHESGYGWKQRGEAAAEVIRRRLD